MFGTREWESSNGIIVNNVVCLVGFSFQDRNDILLFVVLHSSIPVKRVRNATFIPLGPHFSSFVNRFRNIKRKKKNRCGASSIIVIPSQTCTKQFFIVDLPPDVLDLANTGCSSHYYLFVSFLSHLKLIFKLLLSFVFLILVTHFFFAWSLLKTRQFDGSIS